MCGDTTYLLHHRLYECTIKTVKEPTQKGDKMATYKNFIVRDNNGNVVYEGIGGNANAWAARNVYQYGDLFVDYYGEGNDILHHFMGYDTDVYGSTTYKPMTEWVR